MPPARKLQVFVSSTYTDLKEERQAAVEAILTAGHIPAGMELFTAGDRSQMEVIRRWIDESDVFLLILGGRYGSLEAGSGKSYTHLEYEYATEKGKPLFAVVINENALEERVKSAGTKVIEIENAARLREFRQIVLGKMVRFWSDVRDVKLAIHETISDFGRRSDLTGWVRGDQAAGGGPLRDEIARITKENNELRNRLAAGSAQAAYNGVSFDQLFSLLRNEDVDLEDFTPAACQALGEIAVIFRDSTPRLLHVFWHSKERFLPGFSIETQELTFYYFARLAFYGLLTLKGQGDFRYPELTSEGRSFLLRLMSEYSDVREQGDAT